MEETQNQSQGFSQGTSQPQENRVSFPTVGTEKKNGGAKTLLIVGILVLIGILGYVIYKSASGKDNGTALTEPTPYQNMAAPDETVSPIASPTPTLAAADKTKVKIQIQNGTGITGEAAYLETLLKGLGYTNITVGNSPTQNATDTQVSYSSSVSSSVISEITAKLNTVYQSVKSVNSTSTAYDVVIITGLRKGATAKPTSTPTAAPTAIPTATPTTAP